MMQAWRLGGWNGKAYRGRLPSWCWIAAALRRKCRAVAAVEFALTFPVVLFMFAGVTDFGFAYYQEISLSTAVSAGAEYAEVTDAGGASPPAEASVKSVMQSAAAQALQGVASTAYAACYCITGQDSLDFPPDPTVNRLTAVACSSTCSGAPSTLKYMWVKLSAPYHSWFPWSMVGSPTLSRWTWIPIQ